MTDRRGCRARSGPVLAVERFLEENPGVFRPEELPRALADVLGPSDAAEVVAYLLVSGRAALDDDGYLVRQG